MKFVSVRPFADPEAAARELIEIANASVWPLCRSAIIRGQAEEAALPSGVPASSGLLQADPL